MNRSLDALLSARPDAVLMDLDNTLYPYAPAHEAGMDAVRDKCRIELGIGDRRFETTFAEARWAVKQTLGETAAAHHRLLYFQRFIEKITNKSDALLSLELEKIYWRRYLSFARLFPHARDMIELLRYAGIPTAVVSDQTAQIQLRKLVFLELDQSFDAIVTSEEVGAEKPDARVFRLALRKLRLPESGNRVWMIGDEPLRDIQGAKSAIAAQTIQKIHDGVQPTPAADVQITDFAVLADAIRRKL